MRSTYFCGPLEVEVSAEDAPLHAKVVETLELFDVVWERPHARVKLSVVRAGAPASMVEGTSLVCERMRVDWMPTGLYGTCPSGASCRSSADGRSWLIFVPSGGADTVPDDVENFILLMLTTSWRDFGWVPVHAGAVAKGNCCAILCAPSSGGKTTTTAALVRRQWRALGDDKLLLRLSDGGRPELAALQHTFNLHPRTRGWFPEVGDLERRPRHSVWTDKRKVRIEEVWPGQALRRGSPSHLVHINRSDDRCGVRIAPIGSHEVLDVLLRQTVVPSDRAGAQRVLAAIVPTARRLVGVRIDLGREAFRDADCLAGLEQALQ